MTDLGYSIMHQRDAAFYRFNCKKWSDFNESIANFTQTEISNAKKCFKLILKKMFNAKSLWKMLKTTWCSTKMSQSSNNIWLKIDLNLLCQNYCVSELFRNFLIWFYIAPTLVKWWFPEFTGGVRPQASISALYKS